MDVYEINKIASATFNFTYKRVDEKIKSTVLISGTIKYRWINYK